MNKLLKDNIYIILILILILSAGIGYLIARFIKHNTNPSVGSPIEVSSAPVPISLEILNGQIDCTIPGSVKCDACNTTMQNKTDFAQAFIKKCSSWCASNCPPNKK